MPSQKIRIFDVSISPVSSSVIDDDCVSALALALAENTSISHFPLAYNRITSIGSEYLLCLLDNNSAILDVDLKGHSIDDDVLAELNFTLKLRRICFSRY